MAISKMNFPLREIKPGVGSLFVCRWQTLTTNQLHHQNSGQNIPTQNLMNSYFWEPALNAFDCVNITRSIHGVPLGSLHPGTHVGVRMGWSSTQHSQRHSQTYTRVFAVDSTLIQCGSSALQANMRKHEDIAILVCLNVHYAEEDENADICNTSTLKYFFVRAPQFQEEIIITVDGNYFHQQSGAASFARGLFD